MKMKCKVKDCSDDIILEFCPLILRAEREAMIASIYNKPVVFMHGQQPSEIIDVVRMALNENVSFN